MTAAPGLAGQVWLLLRTARRRARGRGARNRRLFQSRNANAAWSMDWGWAGYAAMMALSACLHGIAAFGAVVAGLIGNAAAGWHGQRAHGLIANAHAVAAGPPSGRMMASIVLLWWSLALACQGEGAELDAQRQHRPVWEWLASLPVRPAALFLAELLAPLAANPLVLTAPVLPGVLYGLTYGRWWGLGAAVLAGVPMALAAAALGKAIEIAIVLRTPPRVRGGLLGIVGWFGFAGLFALFYVPMFARALVPPLARGLRPLAAVPVQAYDLFIGRAADGGLAPWRGIAACWIGAALSLLIAAAIARFGFAAGLVGASDRGIRREVAPAALARRPLVRKELLWLARDRSAIVQAILVPVTFAGLQLVNLRGVFLASAGMGRSEATGFAVAGIIFGAYFLGVLGPRSLASEGPALWIAETWPLGLEPLLRTKARLWLALASVLVLAVLAVGAVRSPAAALWLAAVFVGWLPFADGMALRSVTQVTPAAASGQADGVPAGRRGAPFIGVMAFAGGIAANRPSFAILGVVLSQLTAAAMWQGFRLRLPLLHDAWSQRPPPPPTLLHALVAIAVLIDGTAALTTAIAVATHGHPPPWAVPAGATAVTALVAIGVWRFLDHRQVPMAAVFRWPGDGVRSWRLLPSLGVGLAAGLGLGLLAIGWLWALREAGVRLPAVSPAGDGAPLALALAAVVAAPLAEELLFRGLLFRALAGEWGVARAVLGSTALFAAYHPLVAWVPVGALGALSALLFRRSGRLGASVLLHMSYNGVLVGSALLF